MKLLITFTLILVSTSSFAMSKKQPTEITASGSTVNSKDLLWVGKSDEAKSCEKDKGIDLDRMENDLKTAGITIFMKKKIHDGQMRIQMCGADKGTMNGFQIEKKNLEKATLLGFKSIGTNIND